MRRGWETEGQEGIEKKKTNEEEKKEKKDNGDKAFANCFAFTHYLSIWKHRR